MCIILHTMFELTVRFLTLYTRRGHLALDLVAQRYLTYPQFWCENLLFHDFDMFLYIPSLLALLP